MREGIDLGLCGLSAHAGAEGSGRIAGARRRAWHLLWLVIPGPGAGVACIVHFSARERVGQVWTSLRALGSRKADLPPGWYVEALGRSLFGGQTATVGKLRVGKEVVGLALS